MPTPLRTLLRPRVRVLAVGLTVCCSALLVAQNTFRSGTDLVQLDVSVLDGDRRPITGLGAADFEVFDEGQRRQVETFVEVALPPTTAVNATWTRDVPLDVITNSVAARRIVVIIVDDVSLFESGLSARTTTAVREIGNRAIDALRPGDRAALLFSGDRRRAQPLTADSQLLRNGVERTPLFASGTRGADVRSGECWCGLCMIDVIKDAVDALQTVEGVRKTIVHISAGMVPPRSPQCFEPYLERFQAALDGARAANVAINSFDPREFNSGPLGQSAERLPADPSLDLRREFLRNWSSTTGGRAVVNSNDPDLKVDEVLAETGSYYLLGIAAQEPRSDGAPRRLEVRVNRRGAQVRSRYSYQPRAAAQALATSTTAPLPAVLTPPVGDGITAGNAAALDAMTASLLPRADFPLQVNVAPFAGPHGSSFVALTLAVTSAGTQDVREPAWLEVITRAAKYSGEAVGSQTLKMRWLEPSRTDARRDFELFQKIPLPPGSYELRIGAQHDERAASVYTHVAVPDFPREALSASGLILSATPSPPNGPRDAFADLAPVLPTTRRDFQGDDRVSAFLRVYQRAARQVAEATARTLVQDASGSTVLDESTPLEAVTFGDLRASDYRVNLPISRLDSGEYVLRVTIRAGRDQIERAITFRKAAIVQ